MANISKEIKKEMKKLKTLEIPEELKASFPKTPGPRSMKREEPFSIWFANIVFHYHPVNLKMF